MLNYVFSNSERERGPFLVVVPLTTIEHWRREVEAWTDMNLCMYHDNGGRDMRDLIREYEWYYSGRCDMGMSIYMHIGIHANIKQYTIKHSTRSFVLARVACGAKR